MKNNYNLIDSYFILWWQWQKIDLLDYKIKLLSWLKLVECSRKSKVKCDEEQQGAVDEPTIDSRLPFMNSGQFEILQKLHEYHWNEDQVVDNTISQIYSQIST